MKDIQIIERLMLNHVDLDSRVLEVGCGLGRVMQHLEAVGYRHLIGTDIDELMRTRTAEKGFPVFPPDELDRLEPRSVDAVLMVHVLEHLEWRDMQAFVEQYLAKIRPGGRWIIFVPTLHRRFYNDVDHTRPYFPDGLERLFSVQGKPRQYWSPFRVQLEDIRFRRIPLFPYFSRLHYRLKPSHRVLSAAVAGTSRLLFRLTMGLVSETTGYGAVFTVQHRDA